MPGDASASSDPSLPNDPGVPSAPRVPNVPSARGTLGKPGTLGSPSRGTLVPFGDLATRLLGHLDHLGHLSSLTLHDARNTRETRLTCHLGPDRARQIFFGDPVGRRSLAERSTAHAYPTEMRGV